jgi:hypothetical protein
MAKLFRIVLSIKRLDDTERLPIVFFLGVGMAFLQLNFAPVYQIVSNAGLVPPYIWRYPSRGRAARGSPQILRKRDENEKISAKR